MGKSIAQDEEETLQLGRKLLQIGGQEDTLAAIAAAIGAGGVTPQILAQLDIKTSELRDGLRGAGTRDFTTLETDIEAILARLNVNLSTRASQTTLTAVLAQLNITQSALRDAIRGPNTKNFSTLETDVEGILGDTQVLNDDSLKGMLRSIGDAGVAPTNATGNTLLKLVDNVHSKLNAQLNITVSALRDAIRGASTKDFTTLESDLEAVLGDTQALNDDSIKGILRSLGDAGVTPTNATGNTLLKLVDMVYGKLNTQLDITFSSFRDALRGASSKNFTTLEADLEVVAGDTPALNDDSVKGLLRSLGDAGAAPTNATGNTLLKLGDLIYSKLNTQLDITVSALRDAIRGASTKDFTTLETELAKKVDGATTRATYTVTMTNADQEYSQALPNNCLKFLIHTRDGTAFRIANVTGKVAGPAEPYFTIPANVPYWEDFIDPATMTLYFACADAGKIIELVAWA